MRRVCVVLTARPSWAKLEPVCRALLGTVDLSLVVCASALLERYGRVVDVIRAQGYPVTDEVWSVLEGDTARSSAQGTGQLLMGLAPVLERLRPDVVVVCADRHEVLGAAQAAAYQQIPVAHLQGGERTGCIDDKVRDAITALADYHFVATRAAAIRVYGIVGTWERIWQTGCPSVDLARESLGAPPVTSEALGGAGPPFDLSQPFLIVLQHPDTRTPGHSFRDLTETLAACAQIPLPRVVFWPGQDTGMEGASKAIRVWVSQHPGEVWRTVRNLPPDRFLRLLTQAACLVGNSSAGIREASALGVPVVNVGLRQDGRQRGGNVVDVPPDRARIAAAVRHQMGRGRMAGVSLYGTGTAGRQIAEVLSGERVGDHPGAGRVEGDSREELPIAR